MTDPSPSESTERPSHAWGLDRATRGHVILIGYRGSGKSIVGPLLAERLGLPFFDTDRQIAERGGRTITEIFESDSEQAFRDHERAVIAEVCNRDPHVIAVGGGAVVDDQNISAMRQAGAIIWLTAMASTLWKRIAADSKSQNQRPDLTPEGGSSEIEKLSKGRRARYQAIADLELDTDQLTPSMVTDQVAGWLRRRREPRPAPR